MPDRESSVFKDFDERFDKAFSLINFTIYRYLVEHMRRMTTSLGTDLESVLLLGVLAHLNIAPSFYPGANPEEVLNKDGGPLGGYRPVRLADLAQVSRLPRETVRRKLLRLQEMGKVERTEDGAWQILDSGIDHATRDFSRTSIRRFLETAEQVQNILREAGK